MNRKAAGLLGTLVAISTMVAGCSSSGGSPHASGQGGGGTIKIGVITSLTGPVASTFANVQDGVKARLDLQNAAGGIDGRKLTYVMADDTSTGTGAVSAASRLIHQDKVYGIISDSAFTFAIVRTAAQARVPVIGGSIYDGGPEYLDKSDTNVFDSLGYGTYTYASSAVGKYMKSIGATKVAALGTTSPASTHAATQAIASSEAAGLKKAFLSTSLPLGTTDVGPVVEQLKASGADAAVLSVTQNTAFAIVAALKQDGVHLKSVLLSGGYGQELLDSASSRAVAQNVDFGLLPTPIEDNRPGTKKMVKALKTYAKASGVPSLSAYTGWLGADLFIFGLSKAGSAAPTQKFISSLRASTWDGAGLEAPIDFAHIKPVSGNKDQNGCFYIVRLKGDSFVPQPTANPVCGTNLPK